MRVSDSRAGIARTGAPEASATWAYALRRSSEFGASASACRSVASARAPSFCPASRRASWSSAVTEWNRSAASRSSCAATERRPAAASAAAFSSARSRSPAVEEAAGVCPDEGTARASVRPSPTSALTAGSPAACP
ncbi:MAG: hypothetical protein DMF81_01710 [Acidobacteria bacterium]|nr:MAG: hypothetical protein DMF81_01710 [Acidobacteriota bacterium]